MEKLRSDEIAFLGTMIAIELTKCKTKEEIRQIKNLVYQIYSTISTISC